MRVPFANRLTRFSRGNKDAEAEIEAGQVVDLNEPVILIPAEHKPPRQEVQRAWWKTPRVYIASTGMVFVLGAGAVILISGRSGGGASAANAGPFTAEMSALALPDGDLRMAPTARDSGPTATAARQPEPVAAENPGAQRIAEPVLAAPSVAEPTAENLAANRPTGEPPIEANAIPDGAVDDVRERPDTQPVAIDPTLPPPARLPLRDSGVAGVPAARSVPESAPALDSRPKADRSAARPALLAGVERLIQAINAKNGDQRVRPLLLDPVSQREVAKFVRDEKPTAALGTVDEVQFDGDEATLDIRLGFSWRGSFGVEERETKRFLAVARRDGGRWVFTGVLLTSDLP